MQKCLLPVCGWACVSVCAHHVYVNINPAGTVFKCQTFNLLNLTLGDVQACQLLTTMCTETRYGSKKKKEKRQ